MTKLQYWLHCSKVTEYNNYQFHCRKSNECFTQCHVEESMENCVRDIDEYTALPCFHLGIFTWHRSKYHRSKKANQSLKNWQCLYFCKLVLSNVFLQCYTFSVWTAISSVNNIPHITFHSVICLNNMYMMTYHQKDNRQQYNITCKAVLKQDHWCHL